MTALVTRWLLIEVREDRLLFNRLADVVSEVKPRGEKPVYIRMSLRCMPLQQSLYGWFIDRGDSRGHIRSLVCIIRFRPLTFVKSANVTNEV